jgi:hypothetical protein
LSAKLSGPEKIVTGAGPPRKCITAITYATYVRFSSPE